MDEGNSSPVRGDHATVGATLLYPVSRVPHHHPWRATSARVVLSWSCSPSNALPAPRDYSTCYSLTVARQHYVNPTPSRQGGPEPCCPSFLIARFPFG